MTASIISYKVEWDQGNGTWEVLTGVSTHHTALSYLFDKDGRVSSGQSYKFRVAARNKYGWGLYSSEFDILAAEVPGAPNSAVTVQNGLNTQINWIQPSPNGATIQTYDIEIKTA